MDTRYRVRACAAIVAVCVALPYGAGAQKKAKPKIYPTEAAFATTVDGQSCGVCPDGGPYLDGIDGVSSYRVEGAGTTNGWAWDLADRRTTDPRALTYDLTRGDVGTPSFGVVTVHDTHGQTYDLSTILVGETRFVRASFHFFINGVEYVLRFGQMAGDGSSPLKATRTSSGFEVTTDGSSDLAILFRGNGPGATRLGIYHVPLEVLLANQ